MSAAVGKKAARKECEKISERSISSEKVGKSVSPGSKGNKEIWAPIPKTPAKCWGITQRLDPINTWLRDRSN
jgi:hypothetical protein